MRYSREENLAERRANNYENRYGNQQRDKQHTSGYADQRAKEKGQKQIYEYDSAERTGRYVRIVD